jgi:hypothetical protein
MILLDHYRALHAASQRMLAAAHLDHWEEVSGIEDHCRTLIDGLRAAAAQAAQELTPIQTRERMRILLEIVHIDGEVRRLAHPWQNQLDDILTGHPGNGRGRQQG